MRSRAEPVGRSDRAPGRWIAALVLAALCARPGAAADDSAAASAPAAAPAAAATAAAPVAAASGPPSAQSVREVVQRMRADPESGGVHTERRLRWKDADDKPRPKDAKPAPWLLELAAWIAQAGRGVAFLVGAIAIAVLAVFAWRWASVRGEALRQRDELLPSHVNDLDIRPESLPDDIAGAAAALCRGGDQRAALSLLYRGALSRLVHGHAVAIRASSTEGECVQLAKQVLEPSAGAGFDRLVRAWQTEVYAGRSVGADAVLALCADFRRDFAPPAAAAAARAEGAVA